MQVVSIMLIELVGLCIASWFDVETMRIPLWFFPSLYAFEILSMFALGEKPTLETVSTAVFLFLILFVGAMVSNFGGADALASIGFGLTLGFYGIYGIMLSFIYVIPYLVVKKKLADDYPYPFLPFMTLGYFTSLCWSIR